MGPFPLDYPIEGSCLMFKKEERHKHDRKIGFSAITQVRGNGL